VYVRRVLVGRELQRQLMGALLARAHDGSAGTLVVRGEPGVGTTALLDELLAGAGGATVLRTQGLEVEAPLAFAALVGWNQGRAVCGTGLTRVLGRVS
jgi:AAA ATPase domain